MVVSRYFNEPEHGPPSVAPFPRAITRLVGAAYQRQLYSVHRATVIGQGSDPTTILISPNGGCGAATGQQTPFILPMDTTAMVDTYGRPISGGPSEPGPGNLYTQNIGNTGSAIFGFRATPGTARKLPFLSGMTAKRGFKLVKYGAPGYDYTDDAGTTWTSPGTPDPIVRIPQGQINPATVGGVDLSSITLTAGDDGEGAQVLIDGTTITRDPATGVLSAAGGGGGGGGGAGGPVAQYDFQFGAFQTDDGSTTPNPFFVPWTRTVFTEGGFVWDGANPTRMTVPAGGAGTYFITGQLFADSGSLPTLDPASEIEIDAYVNGAFPGPPFGTALPLQITGSAADIQSSGTTLPFTGWFQLNAGDYVEIRLYAPASAGNFVSWNPDYSWCTIVQMGSGSGGATGHQMKLLATGGDSGVAGNWLYDASHTNPLADVPDASISGLTFLSAPIDTDSYFDAGSGSITIPVGMGGTYLVEITLGWQLVAAGNTAAVEFFAELDAAVGQTVSESSWVTDDGATFTAGQDQGTLHYSTIATFADGDSPEPLVSMAGGWQAQGFVEYVLVRLS